MIFFGKKKKGPITSSAIISRGATDGSREPMDAEEVKACNDMLGRIATDKSNGFFLIVEQEGNTTTSHAAGKVSNVNRTHILTSICNAFDIDMESLNTFILQEKLHELTCDKHDHQ